MENVKSQYSTSNEQERKERFNHLMQEDIRVTQVPADER